MSKVDAFIAACKAQLGLPYVWPSERNHYSGKGLVGCLFPEGRDCSGLVSVSLGAAGDLTDRRAMWSAQRYANELEHTDLPQIGDLVVYGAGWGHVTHIEVYMGPDRYLGAIGGNGDTETPEIARRKNACVKFRQSKRPDLLGFLVNPLRGEP